MTRKLTKPSSSPAGLLPTSKVAAGGASGAAAIVIVWFTGLCGLDVPGEVGAAFAVLLSTAGAYLKSNKSVTL